jgi:hypothetical protein
MQKQRWLTGRNASLGAFVIVCGAGSASAGSRPAGVQHDPPRFVDESRTFVTLGGQDDGYVFQLETLLAGYTSASDVVRLDWKQGGKTLASAPCKISEAHDATLVTVRCDQRSQVVKAKGAVEAELVYKDDGDEKEYVVRTFKLTVNQWAKGTWQIDPEDLLGAAYAIDSRHQSIAQTPHPRFRFWVAGGELGRVSPTLRCSVDGKPLPELPASLDATTRIEADIIPPRGERTTWRWSTYEVEASAVGDGAKDPSKNAKLWFIEHPGRWDCFVRLDGRNLRELLFQVNEAGAIDSHPMQAAPGAAPLAPGVSLIDIRIPKDAGIDQRIKPDQLKKSRGFGLPWPNDPSVQAIHAAFPPAVEAARPVAPPKVTGKRLAGAAHVPARFVDEASTEVMLARRADGKTDGYAFNAYALIAGATSATDRVRMDWTQGGKLVATTRCSMDVYQDSSGGVLCRYDGKPLTAKGPIDAELVYSDDGDGNDYLLRTYKVVVAKYPSFGDAVWQLVPDDLLGAAWVKHAGRFVLHDAREGHPHFYFWAAHENNLGNATMRCTVNGAKLPDIKLDGGSPTSAGFQVQAVEHPRTGKELAYRWSHVEGVADVYFGSRADYPGAETMDGKVVFLAEHAGAWVCQVRNDGAAIRELAFTVNDKGFVRSALQTAAGAPPTFDNVSAVELRFPKGATFDTRVRPEAMKKSRGYGLPWPAGPAVKASQATFPPASGLPDPT